MPVWQVSPGAQAVSQPPQWPESFMGFTQTPGFVGSAFAQYNERSNGQKLVHLPPRQTWSVAQALPHAPQFAGSFCMSTQAPSQVGWPG